MNFFKHLIYIPVSGVGLFDDPDDNEWLVYRLGVFQNFTLKSLHQQTRSFILWLSFDGREGNPWIEGLKVILETKYKIPTIVTYDGLIYPDDKYMIRLRGTKEYESTFKQAFRMLGRSIKRKKIKIFSKYLYRLFFKNRTLTKRLNKMLPQVLKKLDNYDYIYLTRMDSDDMLHRDYLYELERYSYSFRRSLVRNTGYVFNNETKELAVWNPTTCPQFFTLIIPKLDFSSSKWFREYWGNYKSHEDADKVFNPIVLSDYKYLMLMHGNQISSTFNHPFKGISIGVGDNLSSEILKDFGL